MTDLKVKRKFKKETVISNPKRLWRQHPCRYSKPETTWSWATCSS